MKSVLAYSNLNILGLFTLLSMIWACEESKRPQIAPPSVNLPDIPVESTISDGFSPMLKPVEEGQCDVSRPSIATNVIRRLTRLEIDNTARELLGDNVPSITEAFPPEEEVLGFDNQSASLQVNDLLVEQQLNAAERLAEYAAQSFNQISPCELNMSQGA